jgi:hypothetical protein
MGLTKEEVAQRYARGIGKIGGADTYIRCGEKKGSGFLAVAECLHDAKAVKLTTENMVQRYKDAA